MLRAILARCLSVAAAAVGVSLGGILVAGAVGWAAQGATTDLRPICNNVGFNLPASVGQSVTIRVHEFAADPDVTPVKLVSVFGGAPLGTVAISGNDLVFTLTSSRAGSVTLYWTFSDSAGLTAQCQSFASNVPPPDNG